MLDSHRYGLIPSMLIFCAFFTFTTISGAGTYSGGSGSAEDPYKISTVADWQELMNTSDDWNKYFILTSDIDMSGVVLIPVASDTDHTEGNFQGTQFSGFFDGKNHVIRNIFINLPDEQFIGLFGYTSSSSLIKDLRLENINLSGRNYVGGLVGYNSGEISNCYSMGTIVGAGPVGGLIGHNYNTGHIETSCSSGTVNGISYVGGLCGYNEGGLPGTYPTSGGGPGTGPSLHILYFNGGGPIISCYSTANVKANSYAGGLVGRNTGSITFCYSNGKVESIGIYTGGMIGWNGGSIVSSFWDVQTSNQATSEWGVGLSTGAMKVADTYFRAGWDLTGEIVNGIRDTWTVPHNGGYPILRWQVTEASILENDEISGAIEIHPGDSIAGSSEGATGIDLTKNGYNDYRDVWYSFIPDEGGKYSISVQGSFDTTLGVFDSVEREVAFNDDFFGGKSVVILKASVGKQYYLRVAGYDGQTGNFTLTVEKGAIQMTQGDLNYDGKVDLVDLSLMAQNWLMGI